MTKRIGTQNSGTLSSGSGSVPPTTSEGVEGQLHVDITRPGAGTVVVSTLALSFTWTYGSVTNFGVDGFNENDIEVRSFGPGGAELTEGSQAIAYLSDFTGMDGDTMFGATLHLPASSVGQVDIIVNAGAGTLTDDSSVVGPPDPRVLTINYNTRRTVQSPGLTIRTPPTTTFYGTSYTLGFFWTEPVSGFTVDDIMLDDMNVMITDFRQTDIEGKGYEATVHFVANSQGDLTVTVPAFSAQGEHARGPAEDVEETFSYDARREQNRTLTGVTAITTLTKTLATLVDGMFVGVLEVLEHGGFVYVVAEVQPSRQSTPNNFPNFNEQAGAELWRITISTGATRLIKSWNYVTTAARSLCVHDGAVHFFEGHYLAYQINSDVDTEIVYDPDLDRNVERRTYAWKEDVGQLYKINGTAVEEVGQSFRSAYINPDDDEAPRDPHYGIHGGMASPMRSVGDNLHLISGYGDLSKINDITDPVSLVANWQWLSYQSIIEPRLPVLETNGKTGWQLIEAIAATTGSVVGFTPSGEFYMKEAEPVSAEIDAALTATGTTATLQNPNSLLIPTSGVCLIDDELLTFTRTGTALTFTGRGQHGTVANSHDAESAILFIDHVLRLDDGTLKQELDSIVFKSDDEWFYNFVEVYHGIHTAPAKDDDSITQHGETKLEITSLLSSKQGVWADWLANLYLSRFSKKREVVTLQIKLDTDINETDVVFLDIPNRAHAQLATEVVEINHDITGQTSEITLITL